MAAVAAAAAAAAVAVAAQWVALGLPPTVCPLAAPQSPARSAVGRPPLKEEEEVREEGEKKRARRQAVAEESDRRTTQTRRLRLVSSHILSTRLPIEQK